jgi:hypothetical protein
MMPLQCSIWLRSSDRSSCASGLNAVSRDSSPARIAMVASGVPSSCAAPAARLPSAMTRSLRSASSRAAASARSRLRMAAAMRATNQAISAAEATKISHMPARCSRVARSASATGSGTFQNTSRE